MRRRLNIPLLAGLFAGTLFLTVGVYLLHEHQVSRNAETLLVRAEKHREAGDLKESLRIMRRYLAHRPEDAAQFKVAARDAINGLYDARSKREVIEKPQIDQAVFLIEEAVRKNGEDPDIRREAAEFWQKMGRSDYVIDNLEPIRDQWTPEDRLKWVSSKQVVGHEVEAIQELQAMTGMDPATGDLDKDKASTPEYLEAYVTLAQLLMRRSLDVQQALKVANQLVNANEENYRAFLLRGKLLPYILGKDGRERGYDDVKQAFKMAPDQVDALLAMALMHMEKKEPDVARDYITKGMEKAETRYEKSRLYNMLVSINIQHEDMEVVSKTIEEGLEAIPYDGDLMWTKARMLLDAKKHDEVRAMKKDLLRAELSSSMIDYLEARILMDSGEFLAAVKQMEEIRPSVRPLVQYEIDAYLSAGYVRTGQLDLRLATIGRMIQARPDELTSHENYVVTLDSLNRSGEALAYLREVMAQLERDEKPIPRSLKNLEASLDMKVTFSTAVDDVDSADLKRIQEKVTKIWNDEEIPEFRRVTMVVDLFRKLNRIDDARTWIRNGLEKDPSQFGLWALSLDFAKTPEEAQETLQKMEKVFAKDHDLEMRSMRSRLAVKYSPDTAADVINAQLQDTSQFSDEQVTSLYYELGALQLILKNREEGLKLLNMAHEKAPRRLDIVSAMFDEAKRGDDPKELQLAVDRIEKITTRNDDTWQMAEAGRIVWMVTRKLAPPEDLDRAREFVQSIRSRRPEWLPAIIEESSIYRLSGRGDAALESLKAAHQLQPTNAQIIRLIAQSYKDQGQTDEANQWMARLPMAMRSANDNRASLSLLWEQRANWTNTEVAAALRMLEQVAPFTTEEVMDLVWRSQILLQAGKNDDAEAAARRAKDLDNQRLEVWTNLVSVLHRQGKSQEVQQYMLEAEKVLPEDQRPIVLGRCYALIDNYKMAQASFNFALQQNPDDMSVKRLLAESLILARDRQKATDYIRGILKTADPENDPGTVAWARRRLAVLLAETNVYSSFNEALQLIEQNAVNGVLEGENLAVWLTLCSRRAEKQSWERALRRLDDIAERRSLTISELFMRATLLEKYGDIHWDEVHQIMTSLLAGGGGTPARIETWVNWLLERKRVSEAKTWAANNLDPNSITKITVDVHDLASRNRNKDALQRLASRTPQSIDSAPRLRAALSIANIAESVGQYDKQFYAYAEAQYKRVYDVLPNQVLFLARAMGVNNDDVTKIQQAVALCLGAEEKKVAKGAIAATLVRILRDNQDRLKSDLSSILPTVSKWFDEAVQADQADLALNWQVAFYFDLISEFDRAEREYQRIIDSPGISEFDRGVAMNNLAYALALNGKRERPLRLINDAEALLGPTGEVIDTRGYIRMVRGELDKAIADFKEAIENGLNVAPKHFHMALAQDQMGNKDEAETAWKQALSFGLNKMDIHPELHGDFEKLAVKFGAQPVAANF